MGHEVTAGDDHERRAIRRRIACALFSTVATVALLRVWVWPIYKSQVSEDAFPDVLFWAVAVLPISLGLVWEAERARSLLLGACVLPLTALIWGATLQHEHQQQDRAIAIFKRYTVHFPKGALGRPYIQQGPSGPGDGIATVCAHQPQRRDYTDFCIEEYFDRPHGLPDEVAGGFRWHPHQEPAENETDDPSVVFDCFGDAVTCGQ